MTYVTPVAKLLTIAQLSTVHLHLIHDHIDIMNKATPTQKSTDLIRIEMVAVTVLVIHLFSTTVSHSQQVKLTRLATSIQ